MSDCLDVGHPFYTSRVLVGADDSAINHDPFTVRLTSKGFENSRPDTTPVPPIETGEDRVPRAKGFRQVPQGSARPVFPEYGFDDRTVVQVRPPHSAVFAGQQRLKPRPHSFSQEGSRHALPQGQTNEVPQLKHLYSPLHPVGPLDFENTP